MWACCPLSAFLSLEISSKVLVRSYSLQFQANTFMGDLLLCIKKHWPWKSHLLSPHSLIAIPLAQVLEQLQMRYFPERMPTSPVSYRKSEPRGHVCKIGFGAICADGIWDWGLMRASLVGFPRPTVLKTATEHPLCWSLSFAYVHPCCKATRRSQIMQKNQHNDTDWWQVDI